MARVHHLNCATMCPAGQRLISGGGSWFSRGRMVCHCALIETDHDGLILIDSGIGTGDIADQKRFHGVFRSVAHPVFEPSETALSQVRVLGFKPADVRHIVVTHLDLDHAGGLGDFPWAKVHVHAYEHRAATVQRSANDKFRYLSEQWAHGPQWVVYEDSGEDWFGLKAIRPLAGLNDVALVPLFGHSAGHSGVAFNVRGRWLLHAGDAFFFHGELEQPARCPAGLRLFQSLVQADKEARLMNADRLRELQRAHGNEIDVFCAHDPLMLEQLKQKSAVREAQAAAAAR